MTDQDFGPGDADAFCELQEVSAEARTHFESLTPQYETQGDCDKYQEAEQTARAAEAMRDLFLMGRVLKRQMGD